MHYKEKKRTEVIPVRVSLEEKKKLEDIAEPLGMPTSTYMRDRSLKGKAANRYANRKAAGGIVRTSHVLYQIYDDLAKTEQETFTKSEVISHLDKIKKEVEAIWY